MKEYHAIYEDFSVEKFIDFLSANKTEPLLVFSFQKVGQHTSRSGNQYDLWSIEFWKDEQTQYFPTIRNWKVATAYLPYFGVIKTQHQDFINETWYSTNTISIADPTGVLREVRFQSTVDEVVEFIKFFYSISKYDSWKNYNLDRENKKLLEEIEVIKSRLSENH